MTMTPFPPDVEVTSLALSEPPPPLLANGVEPAAPPSNAVPNGTVVPLDLRPAPPLPYIIVEPVMFDSRPRPPSKPFAGPAAPPPAPAGNLISLSLASTDEPAKPAPLSPPSAVVFSEMRPPLAVISPKIELPPGLPLITAAPGE